MQTLLSNCRLEEAITTANGVAGATDINGAATDMKGYEGLVAHVKFGPIAADAVTKVKVQESADNVTYTDISGAELAVAADDDNKYKSIDAPNIRQHHARVVVERATGNATVLASWYEKYNPSFAPTQHGAAFETTIATPS